MYLLIFKKQKFLKLSRKLETQQKIMKYHTKPKSIRNILEPTPLHDHPASRLVKTQKLNVIAFAEVRDGTYCKYLNQTICGRFHAFQS